MRCKNRYATNNINISVNVSNGSGSNYGQEILQLQQNIASLRSDVETVSSNDFFKSKFNQFLSDSEIEKIKSLVSQYDEIEDLLSSASKLQYKETEIVFVEGNEDESVIIKAEIDGEWYNLNDTADEDNDSDTLYKLPVKGFVIGVELYTASTGTAKEKFEGIKTSYNADEDITTIFMSKDDYDFVYERRPNNKIHVYSLIIK